jgi:prepilin peptidase CpaA
MNYFTFSAVIILIIFSSLYDIKYRRIPNFITFFAILAGITYHTYTFGYEGFQFSLLGTITGIGLLITPYLLGKMGAGDSKLLGAVGSFIGAKGVLITFIFTAVSGGIYALLIIIIYKSKYKGFLVNLYYSCVNLVVTRKFVSFENGEDVRQRPKLCYGLAIAAGTGIFIIFEVAGIKVLPL